MCQLSDAIHCNMQDSQPSFVVYAYPVDGRRLSFISAEEWQSIAKQFYKDDLSQLQEDIMQQ